MSVILDALKKLEREKSSRRSGTADITLDILRPDLPRPGNRIPLYVAIAFLTSIATAAITYSVMVKNGFLLKPPPPAATAPPALNPEVSSVILSSEPVGDARDEIRPTPPKIQTPVKTKTPPAASVENQGDEKGLNQGVRPGEADLAVEKTNAPPAYTRKGSATASPSLNISAIVWYEETSKRFAMINGLIIAEGAVVEGMKVEEIYPDRVRFLHNGQHLEIFIR
jgi:general secretion pathway protein B